ncbi:HesA/MoeB/ThiF family protein [Dethiosulfatarculus sandiegensis]|nr:HesA/MoeB/ThiF family protein [Dethiosulfatarculus sandiegensis]
MDSRYEVQMRLEDWGEQGQQRLAGKEAAVVGVGALGGTVAALLVRAGVGKLRLIDQDRPNLDNLHRQLLYNEPQVKQGVSKVKAAADTLSLANSNCRIQAFEQMLSKENSAQLLKGVDLVIDGLDNPDARKVLNRSCLELVIPWVHAGVAGYQGQLLVVRPGLSPCLECWFPFDQLKAKYGQKGGGGIFGPLPSCLASIQASEALKFLLGEKEACLTDLLLVDLRGPTFKRLPYRSRNGVGCPVCGYKDFRRAG